ncbi:unnamed protein product, partial [marine sediment metagenome]
GKAIKLDPDLADTYFHRGEVYKTTGQLTRAIADFRQGLKIDPSNQKAKANLAKLESSLPSKSEQPISSGISTATQKKQPGNATSQELDIAFWNSVKDSGDAAMLQAYLDKFPDGVFASLARIKIGKAKK